MTTKVPNKTAKTAKKKRTPPSALLRHTKRDNERFARMTPAEKRVAIAEDVLRAIQLRKLKPNPGDYVKGPRGENLLLRDLGGSFNTLVKRMRAYSSCTVCAKGAVFACFLARDERGGEAIQQEDRYKLFHSPILSRVLRGVFSKRQLALIENEFEGWVVEGLSEDHLEPVMRLASLFEPKKRLQIIMKNIIKNKGTFVPVPA